MTRKILLIGILLTATVLAFLYLKDSPEKRTGSLLLVGGPGEITIHFDWGVIHATQLDNQGDWQLLKAPRIILYGKENTEITAATGRFDKDIKKGTLRGDHDRPVVCEQNRRDRLHV